MKRILTSRILFVALLLGAFNSALLAQPNDADPALTSMSFATSPVQTMHTTTLTVFITNAGFNTSLPAGSFGVNITLPTSDEYVASPLSTAALSGTFASKFTWNYNAGTRNFFGVSNQAIAGGAGGTVIVTVMGVTSVVSRNSLANIQRLNPALYPNENVNNNNLSAALGVVPGVLSVGLLNFTAAPVNRTVKLDWQTTSELNSNYFEVQTSIDGTKWNKIGTVAAAGTSTTERDYSLIHTNPINGLNYYRLKQVDLDGSFKYSVIRTVKFGDKTEIYIMPNPTTDNVFIISGTVGTVKSVSVYSMDGRILQQINNYTYVKAIDLSRYAPSTYLLRVTNNDGTTQVFRAVKK